jgi:hypothetical protein
MKRSSWIVLGVCVVLVIGLVAGYFLSQGGTTTLTQEDAIKMVEKMEEGLRHKNVNAIMGYIAPEAGTRIANVNQDQLRGMLAHYFRNSDSLRADLKNYTFIDSTQEPTLQFDLTVYNNGSDSEKIDYQGHITLHLKRTDVSHLLGLYQTKEWRIVGAETSGPNLDIFGDY